MLVSVLNFECVLNFDCMMVKVRIYDLRTGIGIELLPLSVGCVDCVSILDSG